MASLTDDPTGADFEDFVAAHLATRGVFVEKGVTEREGRDILEIDLVWTDYRALPIQRRAMELKSKGWKLGDYFKFYGWLTYVGIADASFVFRKLQDEIPLDLLGRLATRTKIKALLVDDPLKIGECLGTLGLPEATAPHMAEIWRFSFWSQRRLLLSLSKSVEAEQCPKAGKHAKDAWKLFNDAVFFEPDLRTRVGMLLKEHLEKRYIASAAACEIEKKEPSFEANAITETFQSALYRGTHFPVQSCLYVSHRGRLATLKAAVDYTIAKSRGELTAEVINIFGTDVDVSEVELHGSFKAAVDYLLQQESTPRYAIFWQVFLWAWGGFILTDRKEEEYAALSSETGVPTGEIDKALGLFKILFPRTGGAEWFSSSAADSRHQLVLMPAAIRGIGCYARLIRYGQPTYDKLGLTGKWTWQNMGSDHNSAARLISNDDNELLK